jgi:cytochrome c oxidase cbb3-type subunit 3
MSDSNDLNNKKSNSQNKSEGDSLLGHEYDGIRELDNPLPKWWLMSFYITIVFSIIYYAYYQLGSGPTHDAELALQMKEILGKQKETELNAALVGDIDYVALAGDAASMSRAQQHFTSKCSACHGAGGEGGIGPNLTDRNYLTEKGAFKGLLKLVREGNERGMPKWKGLIPDQEILEVVAYVKSLEGKNLPGKAPQGELVTE